MERPAYLPINPAPAGFIVHVDFASTVSDVRALRESLFMPDPTYKNRRVRIIQIHPLGTHTCLVELIFKEEVKNA